MDTTELDESIHEVIMNASVEELALLKESLIGNREEILEIIQTDSPDKYEKVVAQLNPVIKQKKKKSVNFNHRDIVIEDIEEDIRPEDLCNDGFDNADK